MNYFVETEYYDYSKTNKTMNSCYQQQNSNQSSFHVPQQIVGLDVIGIEPPHNHNQLNMFHTNQDTIYLPETINPNQPITLDVQLDQINFPDYQQKLEPCQQAQVQTQQQQNQQQPILFHPNPDIIYLPETFDPNKPIQLDVQLEQVNHYPFLRKTEPCQQVPIHNESYYQAKHAVYVPPNNQTNQAQQPIILKPEPDIIYLPDDKNMPIYLDILIDPVNLPPQQVQPCQPQQPPKVGEYVMVPPPPSQPYQQTCQPGCQTLSQPSCEPVVVCQQAVQIQSQPCFDSIPQFREVAYNQSEPYFDSMAQCQEVAYTQSQSSCKQSEPIYVTAQNIQQPSSCCEPQAIQESIKCHQESNSQPCAQTCVQPGSQPCQQPCIEQSYQPTVQHYDPCHPCPTPTYRKPVCYPHCQPRCKPPPPCPVYLPTLYKRYGHINYCRPPPPPIYCQSSGPELLAEFSDILGPRLERHYHYIKKGATNRYRRQPFAPITQYCHDEFYDYNPKRYSRRKKRYSSKPKRYYEEYKVPYEEYSSPRRTKECNDFFPKKTNYYNDDYQYDEPVYKYSYSSRERHSQPEKFYQDEQDYYEHETKYRYEDDFDNRHVPGGSIDRNYSNKDYKKKSTSYYDDGYVSTGYNKDHPKSYTENYTTKTYNKKSENYIDGKYDNNYQDAYISNNRYKKKDYYRDDYYTDENYIKSKNEYEIKLDYNKYENQYDPYTTKAPGGKYKTPNNEYVTHNRYDNSPRRDKGYNLDEDELPSKIAGYPGIYFDSMSSSPYTDKEGDFEQRFFDKTLTEDIYYEKKNRNSATKQTSNNYYKEFRTKNYA